MTVGIGFCNRRLSHLFQLNKTSRAVSQIFAAFKIQRFLIMLLGHFHQSQQIKLMLRQFIHIVMSYIGRDFLFHQVNGF